MVMVFYKSKQGAAQNNNYQTRTERVSITTNLARPGRINFFERSISEKDEKKFNHGPNRICQKGIIIIIIIIIIIAKIIREGFGFAWQVGTLGICKINLWLRILLCMEDIQHSSNQK